ncbi:unnamed protein product, partial [Ceratitis capitata]
MPSQQLRNSTKHWRNDDTIIIITNSNSNSSVENNRIWFNFFLIIKNYERKDFTNKQQQQVDPVLFAFMVQFTINFAQSWLFSAINLENIFTSMQ